MCLEELTEGVEGCQSLQGLPGEANETSNAGDCRNGFHYVIESREVKLEQSVNIEIDSL